MSTHYKTNPQGQKAAALEARLAQHRQQQQQRHSQVINRPSTARPQFPKPTGNQR